MKTFQDSCLSSEDVQNAESTKLAVTFFYGDIYCAANWYVGLKPSFETDRVFLLGAYLKGLWMSRSMCSPLINSSPSPGWTPIVSVRYWKEKRKQTNLMLDAKILKLVKKKVNQYLIFWTKRKMCRDNISR